MLLQGRPCAPGFLAASEAKASAASESDCEWVIGEPRLEVLAAKSLKAGVGCCYSVRRSGSDVYCGRWRFRWCWRPFRQAGCLAREARRMGACSKRRLAKATTSSTA